MIISDKFLNLCIEKMRSDIKSAKIKQLEAAIQQAEAEAVILKAAAEIIKGKPLTPESESALAAAWISAVELKKGD